MVQKRENPLFPLPVQHDFPQMKYHLRRRATRPEAWTRILILPTQSLGEKTGPILHKPDVIWTLFKLAKSMNTLSNITAKDMTQIWPSKTWVVLFIQSLSYLYQSKSYSAHPNWLYLSVHYSVHLNCAHLNCAHLGADNISHCYRRLKSFLLFVSRIFDVAQQRAAVSTNAANEVQESDYILATAWKPKWWNPSATFQWWQQILMIVMN